MTFHIELPQFIYLLLVFVEIVYNTIKHGENKGDYHAGASICTMLVVTALLYWGGFFK